MGLGHCYPPKSQMHLPVRYAILLSYRRLLAIFDSSRAQGGTVIPVVTVDHTAVNIMAFAEAILYSDSVWKSDTDTQCRQMPLLCPPPKEFQFLL